jgi:hypothetical protein
MTSIRKGYTRRRSNGGGLLPSFLSKKLSDKEKAWKSHIELRSAFMKDLKIKVAKREKVCGDADSRKASSIMKKLKKSIKLAEVSKFVRDLGDLTEIIKKWDERVVSYATDLGKTCGMFDVVERKSDILIFISARISYEHEKDPDMYSWEVRPVLKPGVTEPVGQRAPVKDGRTRDVLGRFIKKPDLTRKDRDDVRKIFNRRVIDTRAEDRIQGLKENVKSEKSLRWRPYYSQDSRKLTSPDRTWVKGEVDKYGMYNDIPGKNPLDKGFDPRYYPTGPLAKTGKRLDPRYYPTGPLAKTGKRLDPRYYPADPPAAIKERWGKPLASDESIMEIIRKQKKGAEQKHIDEIGRKEREEIKKRAERIISERNVPPPVPVPAPARAPEPAPARAPEPAPEKSSGFIDNVKSLFGKNENDDKVEEEDQDPVKGPAPAPAPFQQPNVEPNIDDELRPTTPVAIPIYDRPSAPVPEPTPLSMPNLTSGPSVGVDDNIETLGESSVLEINNGPNSSNQSPYFRDRKIPSNETVINIKRPTIEGQDIKSTRMNMDRDRVLQLKGAKEMMDKTRERNAVKNSEMLENMKNEERGRNDTIAKMLEETAEQKASQLDEENNLNKAKIASFEDIQQKILTRDDLQASKTLDNMKRTTLEINRPNKYTLEEITD